MSTTPTGQRREADRPRGLDGHRGRGVGARTAADEARSSYYGVPPIHKPHWKWLVVVYFFLGGIAGASYVIAAVSHLVGPKEDQPIARAGRYLSLAALVPCPILLVLDLHRPRRFLNMLRVVKFRSPMSVGTWGLLLFSGFSGLSALIQAAEDGLLGRGRAVGVMSRLPARAVAVAGTPFGFFVAGYTGVLLAATAVPLWAKNARFMGPLFLSSAFSTAASAITLVLSLRRRTPGEALHRLERLERAAMVAELGLLAASRARLGPTAKPVVEGRLGGLLRYGTVGGGLLVPLAIQTASAIAGRPPSRPISMLASALVLTGGFVLRHAVVAGGRASADDPEATFAYARRGLLETPPR